jgi:hypothetical protein
MCWALLLLLLLLLCSPSRLLRRGMTKAHVPVTVLLHLL